MGPAREPGHDGQVVQDASVRRFACASLSRQTAVTRRRVQHVQPAWAGPDDGSSFDSPFLHESPRMQRIL